MRTLFHTIALVTLLGTALSAVAQRAYVVDSRGNRRPFDDIKADSTGQLTLSIGGSTILLKPNQYDYVVTPMPDDVRKLERFAEQGNNKVVIQNAANIFNKYKYLGWGGYVASLEAMAKLDENDPQGALQAVNKAANTAIVGRYRDQVNKAKISALIALDRGDEAAPLLQQLKATADDELAAFAFLADGRILEKQGRQQEALLAYLKTVLLFKDGVADAEKRQAKARVAALLEERGDPRAKDFR